MLVESPPPLHLVDPLWHFWDANWWPDWEKSAKKLMWFYEKSDGPTVDGVISFTPTVVENLLEIIGPIDMSKEYGQIITADNFWLTVQKISEEKLTPEQEAAGEEHEPKRVIGDLMQKIVDDLPKNLNKDNIIKLISLFEDNLKQKQILFYFENKDLQQEVVKRGWAGKIENTDYDYLSVISTNIAGGKSDKKIVQDIDHQAVMQPDGSIIDTVTISRGHTGVKNEPFSGVRNVSWLRVYVPLNSELLEVEGFEAPDQIYFEEPEDFWQQDPLLENEKYAKIDKESNTKIYNEDFKTVFANWVMTDPGQISVIKLKYRLPFKLEIKQSPNSWQKKLDNLFRKVFKKEKKNLVNYSMLAQKQPGDQHTVLESSFEVNQDFNIYWKYPEELQNDENFCQINTDMDSDKFWAITLQKKEK